MVNINIQKVQSLLLARVITYVIGIKVDTHTIQYPAYTLGAICINNAIMVLVVMMMMRRRYGR